MKMDYEQTVEELSKAGWRKYPASCRYAKEIWGKRFENAPVCRCNDDKRGVQIVIAVYQSDDRTSYEIDLTAEKPDGQWVKFQVYGINDALCEVLDAQVTALLKAWEAVQ